MIGRTLLEAGIEPDVLHVVIGKSSVIEDELLTAPELGGVSLTGSYETPVRSVAPSRSRVPFQAELGARTPSSCGATRTYRLAVDLIRQSAFRQQRPDLHLGREGARARRGVRRAARPALSGAVTTLQASRRAGRARHPRLGLGAGQGGGRRSRRRGTEARDVVRADWGDRTPPTVIVDPPVGPLTRDEIFGPVVTFERVSDLDEAIELANDTAYGLTSGIVTSDVSVARRYWLGVRAGTVKVNAPMTGTPFHVPFEGHGHSGAGHSEGGLDSLDFFTRTKTISCRGTR